MQTVQHYAPDKAPLAGFESVGTIVISYSFSSGVQGPEHPSPGRQRLAFPFLSFPMRFGTHRRMLAGHRYYGTSRVAYLPDNPDGTVRAAASQLTHSLILYLFRCCEGNEVLGLLQECFDLRQTFTVGTSITTGFHIHPNLMTLSYICASGQSNSVIWNGVHHKTNTHGGTSSFGYPDATYFTRVKEELKAKGIE